MTGEQWMAEKGIGLPVIFGIFAVCLAAFTALNYPKFMPQTKDEEQAAQQDNRFDHGMVYLRLALILLFILASVYVAYVI